MILYWLMMHSKEHKYIVSLDIHAVHVQVCDRDVSWQTEVYFDQHRYARAETAVSAAVSGGESKDVGGDG